MNKGEKFDTVRSQIISMGFSITKEDDSRPWGGFFVIDEEQSEKFINTFFPEVKKPKEKTSPKILLIEPQKKLSWQYHHRRSEMWKSIGGRVGVVKSFTDKENIPIELQKDETIILKKEERHRLVGLSEWGVIAEIWIHTDPQNPSNEEDIIRIQDDFGR